MEFNVLGPLEVLDPDGRAIVLPTGRERALLVMLLLRRGEVVSVDALVDGLWGGNLPATAAKGCEPVVLPVAPEPLEEGEVVAAAREQAVERDGGPEDERCAIATPYRGERSGDDQGDSGWRSGPARSDALVDHRKGSTMSDTTTPTALSPSETERRLVRPADDRVVAGVCSGLGRYFDVNPLAYRVAFAALVLLGGAGFVLYAAAWLVIPDERRGDSIVGQALHDRRHGPWLAVGIGLLGAGLIVAASESWLWPGESALWVTALAVGAAVVWWQLRDRPPTVEGSALVEDVPVAGTGEGAPAAATDDATPPAPARRRVPVTLATLGVVLAGAGVLGLLDATGAVSVDWTVALAAGVVVVGLAVAVGAFFDRTGLLAVFGLLLAGVMLLAVTIDIPLRGSIGDRTVTPATVQELDRSYEQSIGALELDLGGLPLPAGTTRVDATVGIGELVVRVPDDARVTVEASVTAGNVDVLGTQDDGWRVERTVVVEGSAPDAPTLVIDAEVGFGDLRVRRG